MPDSTFITNDLNGSLEQRFIELKNYIDKFDILVGYFFISGFYKIYSLLEDTKEIRILIGINTDNTILNLNNDKNELFSQSSEYEKTNYVLNNYINELEKCENKINIENGIIKFLDWVKSGKLIIKCYQKQIIHAKVYIMTMKNSPDKGRVFTGSSNLTSAGLADNIEFNVELKNNNDHKFALDFFNELWKESIDLNQKIVETILNSTWLKSDITAKQIYYKVLYEYFKEDLNLNTDVFYRNFPENFKKLKYQEQAVINAKKILEKYNGVFIADVVGLGKTFICTMLAAQLNKRILVIASPNLLDEKNANSWKNVFHSFSIPAKFKSIGKLDDVIKEGTDRFDLVIIDESHRFRNDETQNYELLKQICAGKKVILASATPYNNRPKDILNQIGLFQPLRKSDIPGIPNLEKFFNKLNEKLKDFEKGSDEFFEQVKENSKQIRRKVLRYLMIRRTRKDIQNYFKSDLKNEGKDFPKVHTPEPLLYKLDNKTSKAFDQTIGMLTNEKDFVYSRYRPATYLINPQDDFTMRSQMNMTKFMKILLLKRLESSFHSFEMTLSRFIKSYEMFIKSFQRGKIYVSKKYAKKIYEYSETGKIDKIQDLIDNDKAEEFNSSDFNNNFIKDLKNDLITLKTIGKLWSEIIKDPKIEKFKSALKSNEILKRSKMILFTESLETAEYLTKNLEKNAKCIVYHGSKTKIDLEKVLENFDKNHETHKDDYNLLITTDVLAEGVNLHRANVIINYDIPWNPTRMIQRVGRINRLDTDFNDLYTFNFFPTDEVEDEIKLKEIAMTKITSFIEMLGNDAKLLTETEDVKSHELWSKLNSDEAIKETDEGDPELKYLTIIKDIKEKNPELFNQIVNLPKKARISLKSNEFKNIMLSYFRKKNLEKFYKIKNDVVEEIDFVEAADNFDKNQELTTQKIDSESYYKFYNSIAEKINRDSDIEDEESNIRTGTKGYDTKIKNRLKSIKSNKDFIKSDENKKYIKDLMDLLDSSSIPKMTLGKAWNKIEKLIKPDEVLKVLRIEIPKEYFTTHKEKTVTNIKHIEEIILSEIY